MAFWGISQRSSPLDNHLVTNYSNGYCLYSEEQNQPQCLLNLHCSNASPSYAVTMYSFVLIRHVVLTWRFAASFDQAGKLALELTGSQRHHVNKSTSSFSGTISICRGDLAKALMDKAARLPNVTVRFGCSLQSLDMQNRSTYSIPCGGSIAMPASFYSHSFIFVYQLNKG